MFVFPDCHFYVANGIPSQLVLLDNWHPTDTVLFFKPGFLESRRHTSNLQASIYFQVRSCTMLFVVFLKHYHICRSIMRLEVQISVCLARCTLVPSTSCFEINLSLLHRFEEQQTTYPRDYRCACIWLSCFVSLHFVMERNVLFLIRKCFWAISVERENWYS